MPDALKWRSLISILRFRSTLFSTVLTAIYRLRHAVLPFFVLVSSLLTLASANDLTTENSHEKEGMPVAIIVNQSVQLDGVSLRDLRAIYAMKKRFWNEQQAISVFVLANDDALHQEFCKKLLGIFPNQLESIWYRQVYTGTGKAPVTLSSRTEIITKVATTPGAIGYIDNNNIEQMQADENIKILSIH